MPLEMLERQRGIFSGIVAYFIWGLFPLYWPLLKPAGTLEILAHRVVWSLLFVLAILVIRRQLSMACNSMWNRKTLICLSLSSAMIAINWGTYIYVVNSARTLDASLGYFIMPLFSIVCGVIFFRERLRAIQWVAIGIAIIAILIQSFFYGHIPWIPIVLAASFGGYGIFKKLAHAHATGSMLLETSILTLPALFYIIFIQTHGQAAFMQGTALHATLLVFGGVVTVVPLILLSNAAVNIPLSTLGMLQYITPSIQFLIGWGLQGEAMPLARWLGFSLIWVALFILVIDSTLIRRKQLREQGVQSDACTH